jgi:fatty-acyl-CoA synthase
VAINTRLSSSEIAYILHHSGAKVLCVDSELADLIRPIRDQLTSLETVVHVADREAHAGLDGPEYEAFLDTGSEAVVEKPVTDENEVISINYTSGTTGHPKGVMYTHRSAYLNALGEVLEVGVNSRSTYLWTLPMFHCNGWCFTWGVTAVGATHICLRRINAEEVFRLIEVERVSHLNAAPTVLITLTSHPRAKTATFPRQLHVTTAGAPPSPTVIANMEALGAEIFHVYGLTETYGPHSVCAWHEAWETLPALERARKKARQGVPYIVAEEMRVVDEQMQDVPRDAATMGEVIMRGNNVMKGYYEQPDATAEAFRGGWFHSGDLAVVHPDGYAELRDRKKDIIISGGENISTIEVENTIYQHPDVQEVAVIAIPHETWGEVPKAFVVPKPDTQPTAEDIMQFCRDRLAHFKCPKAVEFGELPKTSTGKIKKFELREKEWKGYESRIH